MGAPPLTVAAVQLSSQNDVLSNLSRVTALVARAAGRGARLVVLPEGFAYMGSEEGKRATAEEVPARGAPSQPGPVLRAVSAAARASRVWVVAGGMAEKSGDAARPYNACVVVGPDGSVAARYRKMHLFDVSLPDGSEHKESASTTAGGEVVSVDVEGWRIGLSICYDVRFPELYRKLSDAGATVLVVPSAFTLVTGKDHWHVLLRARAIEAQAYVVAAAQWGRHPGGRQTYGKSIVVDPWGEVVAQASEGEGIAVADLDGEYLERVRRSVPALEHRRLR